MKKLFYPMFALATMAMTTSCSDELENGAVSNGNEATVSFKVQLEDAVGSRALGDGKTTAKYLTFAIFKAEANAIGEEVEALRQQVEVQEDLTATVSTRLVKGQTYNFVFWAQSESVALEDDAATTDINEKGAGTYYNIADMSAIKVNYTNNKIAANDEMRDAFYASRNNLTVKGPITETITLKRPFAQVNVGTKEGSLAESATAETNITQSSIVFSEVATELYPYSGKVGGKAENVEYTIAAIPEDLTTTGGDLQKVMVDGKETAFEYLSMNYILVNDQSQNGDGVITGANQDVLNNATFTIYDENNKAINTFEIPNLPVQRNWRTNIIGDILNETVTFNVVIDPEFDNDHNYITNEELAYVLENGGTYTMEEDLTLESSLKLNNGVSVVLNLNGYNITAASTDAIVVDGGSTLTINGNGNIKAATDDKSSANAIWLKHGKAIINGGNYYVGADNLLRNDCIYVGSDAQKDNAANLVSELIINAGTFEAKVEEAGQYWVLNLQDKFYTAGSTIKVYGGKFINFNPANNASEGAGTDFVADGYEAVKDASEDIWYVVKEGSSVATDATTLAASLVLADAKVAIVEDVTVTEKVTMGATSLDGGNNTLTMSVDDDGTYALGIVVPGGEIKNLVIDGENKKSAQNGKGYRALWFDNVTKDVKIDNVNISGVAYTMNTGATIANGLKLTVTNSTLVGWTSYDKFASANFNNVHFGVGSYYTEAEMTAGNGDYWNGCLRPYVTTYLSNCTFEEGFVLKLDKLAAGATITLKNCMVGNQVVNAGNIQTLLGVAYNDATIKF